MMGSAKGLFLFLVLLQHNLFFQWTDGAPISTTRLPPGEGEEEATWDREVQYWPGGIIPYVLPNDTYNEKQIGTIVAAMRRWSHKTCITFVPWTEHMAGSNYLLFYGGGNCFSDVGMTGRRRQIIGLGTGGCVTIGTAVHEIGHAIGMIHTMERNDRDRYLRIQAENMQSASTRNFLTTADKGLRYDFYNTPYDYKSIMHYGQKAWSRNGRPVMVTTDPVYQDIIGKGNDVSFFDALYVNRAYNCSSRCPSSLAGMCRNGGFVGGSNCHCICHDGYTGEFCEIPLPGYQHIARYDCQTGWTYADGKCYLFFDTSMSFTMSRMYCNSTNASLVMWNSRPEMETISRLVTEEVLRGPFNSFWIGMTQPLEANATTWLDGSLVDPNLVVPRVEGDRSVDNLCGNFDGSTVSLTPCNSDPTRSVICVKDFDDTCGGRYYISGTWTRTLQSPGFPVQYPEEIRCQYVLQSAENTRINITFTNFTLEDNCNRDYLEVKLTNDVTEDGISYCGTDLRGKTLTSNANIAVLTFVTNRRNNFQGFLVTAQATPLYSWTTPSPFRFLDTINNKLQQAKTQVGNEFLSLSNIWKAIKGMVFSHIL